MAVPYIFLISSLFYWLSDGQDWVVRVSELLVVVVVAMVVVGCHDGRNHCIFLNSVVSVAQRAL